MTIVGHKDDRRAQALHALARALPARYRTAGMARSARGKLPNADVEYPISASPRVRLQQPHLLVPLLHGRGTAGQVKQMGS